MLQSLKYSAYTQNVLPSDEKFKVKDVSFVKAETAKERQIKDEIERLESWEDYVKSHELAHGVVGGSSVGSSSYVYTYGPDGKKYIQGGQVSVYIPKGLDEASMASLKRLKNAPGASKDMSMKDMTSGAIISAVERSRAFKLRMKEATEKYEKQKILEAEEAIDNGQEIFAYKKLDISSTRLIELFV
ncbi:hypothetical protein EZV73_18490 [Acidaminobacter sp. JC074]|uniref:putative metalloprotease CJM1_0395 family protein n=1 Tax=Acidaminobacter sp. JC074 TaxID=2530199 RepID=UPI001F1136E3|nr:putative metalloprotease CJM1_0395 family protein [Acidaminobacter sp. JC074]MCH4889577.1 hypothetical protein [Acidaminobacter sp. JC074]